MLFYPFLDTASKEMTFNIMDVFENKMNPMFFFLLKNVKLHATENAGIHFRLNALEKSFSGKGNENVMSEL